MSLGRILELLEAFRAKPYPLRKPVVIQFPVNDICDAKCQMCNIWQQHFDHQVSLQEIDQIFSNSLFSQVRGIGLNGGEPTLRADLPDIADILFARLPRLRHVSLITNGTRANRVIERVDRLAAVVRRHRGHLDVMVSLDGVEEVHDRVRGREGNFRNAIEVLDHLRLHPDVQSTRVGCTVIRENVYGVHDLYDFARKRNVYIKYRLGVPHQRLYTAPAESRQIGKRTWVFTRPYDLDFPARVHLAEFLWGLIRHYEPSWQQQYFYQSLIGQILEGASRQAGCDWQHRGATVSSRGELLYCAVQSPVLGDAIRGNAQKLYFDNVGRLHGIIATHCDQCAHDYVGRPPGRVLLRETIRETLGHLGVKPISIKKLPGIRLWFTRNAQQRFDARYREILKLASVEVRHATDVAPTVLICGWYGTETLGDKAILGGVIASVRRAMPNARLLLASLYPYVSRMTCLQMPELAPVEVVDLAGAARRLHETDLLVFGGGPLMAIDEMADMEALFATAKDSGIPSIVAGCGVGPLGAAFRNAAIGHLLQLADVRIYRDEGSCKAARALGVDVSEDAVAEDPAFEWIARRRREDAVVRAERPTLLLGLRDWPYREYAAFLPEAEAETIKVRFETEVMAALEALARRVPDLVILPLPMCTNHLGDDDRFYYRKLFEGGRLAAYLDTRLLGQELAPNDYLAEFLKAHCALTMRFHASVFALGCGLPAVALDYTLGQGKVAAIAQRFGMPCIDLRNVQAASLTEALHEQLQSGPFSAPLPTFSAVLARALERQIKREISAV